MPTAKVDITSDIVRKEWIHEGLLEKAYKSFWSPLTGNTKESVVHQVNDRKAGSGHTVVFDSVGNLSGKPIVGKDTATGKGEQKKIFSSKITVERHRQVVENGDKFDGVDIGNLAITEHAQSRSMLGDLFTKTKDQAIFDAAQGLSGSAPTHSIDLNASFGFNELLDIEQMLKTSVGFSTGGVRKPLDFYTTKDGNPCWLFVIDSFMAYKLKKDPKYQTLIFNADVRGNNNRAFKGIIGKIGDLIIMEAGNFFGETDANGLTKRNATSVEKSGLRQKDGAGLWTGEQGFSYGGDLYSRGLLLGGNAIQMAFGKLPDYQWQKSQDFGITSESMVEYWFNVQKTKLKAENTDYKQAKVADIDYGVIAVNVKSQSTAFYDPAPPPVKTKAKKAQKAPEKTEAPETPVKDEEKDS